MKYFQKENFALIVLFFGLFNANSVAMAQENRYVMGIDTVAGQESLLRAKNFDPEENVVFHVLPPEHDEIRLMGQADASGEAYARLSGLHTHTSGKYQLYASSIDGLEKSAGCTFNVYADVMDSDISSMMTARAVIKADGVDYAQIKVELSDKFGNPIEDRAVKLLSTSQKVAIEPKTGVTDETGSIGFKALTQDPGLVTFMALDTTTDQFLDERLRISYVDDDKFLADAGGDLINMAYAADFGVLDHFEISGIPAAVDRNENVSFTVKAVDMDGAIVEDYSGTVRFSAEGVNSSAVSLPENYKFLAGDLGQHNFSLGLSFAEDGTYKIVVSDLNDKFKQGSQTIVVGNGQDDSLESGSGIKPVISIPAPGTYSQAEQTVSGTAKTSSTIKIFDNNEEIGSVPVGPTGKFSFEMSELQDGEHSIYVENIDSISLEVIGTSDPVEIKIDTTPPDIDEIQLDPSENIKPGDVINVKVYSEKNLSQAALIFNYDIIELNASMEDPSIYIGTIQAPQDFGVYGLNVLLVDELQNEITYEDQATVNVTEEGGNADFVMPNETDITEEDGQIPDNNTGEIVPVEGMPSQVTGLIAYGSDKRVTLVWDASTDDSLISHYKIYYGTEVQNLVYSVQTKDASTTWYVPGLDNGKEYFFAMTAVDDQGNESLTKSEIVSGIPFVLEIRNALTESPIQSIVDASLHQAAYNGPFPTKTTSTGPELLFILAGSALAGYMVSKKKK